MKPDKKTCDRRRAIGLRAAICMLAAAAGVSPCVGAPGLIGAYVGPETAEMVDTFDLFVADQVTYDSNLYRLPADSAELGLAPVRSRSDFFNTATAGAEGEYLFGLQDLQFSAQADDNRFDRNTNLDDVSGGARALLNWRVGRIFLGDAGLDYTRHLAGFASTGYLGKDILSHGDYYGDARWQLGPRWALFGGIMGSNTDNSADVLRNNDNHTKSGTAGAEVATAVNNAIGVEYRYADGHYSLSEGILNGVPFNRDYRDNSVRGYVRYQLTDKTTLFGSAGYLRRNYIGSSIGAFSGDVWNLSVQWQATDKTQVTLTANRDLQANLDAESDYYVSQGFALQPSWQASEKISLKAAIAWHDLNYIGSSPSAIEVKSRHDKAAYGQIDLVYIPIRSLTFDVGYHYEKRDSNQDIFRYDDNHASASVVFKFL